MSTTYTEGGPGRKACTCGIFVAARTNVCPKCGHVFVSRSAVVGRRSAEKPDSTDHRPGTLDPKAKPKGRGPVPTWEPRPEGSRGERSRTDHEEGAPATRGKDILLVPSGPCPVPLEGVDRGAVQEWTYFLCDALPSYTVSRSAASQFLRQFHPMGSDEYEIACSHLVHCRSLFADADFERFQKSRPGSVSEGASS